MDNIEWSEELISDLEVLDRWCLTLREKLKVLPNEKDRFALEILFREALQNAFSHGNCGRSDLKIRCGLNIRDHEASGWVHSDGPSWDYARCIHPCAQAGDENGRGLEIIGKYSDHFHWDDQGKTIYFTRILKKGGKLG